MVLRLAVKRLSKTHPDTLIRKLIRKGQCVIGSDLRGALLNTACNQNRGCSARFHNSAPSYAARNTHWASEEVTLNIRCGVGDANGSYVYVVPRLVPLSVI